MMRFFHYYKDFSSVQFAADDYFRQWVLRPDEELERFWLGFPEAYPHQAGRLNRAKQLVEVEAYNKYGVGPLSAEEKASMKEELLDRLGLAEWPALAVNEMGLTNDGPDPAEAQADRGAVQEPAAVRVRRLSAGWMAAAAVLLLAAAAWLLKAIAVLPMGKVVLLAERTGPNEKKTILLPDSSVVVLNAGSLLEYNSDMAAAGAREMRLEGNAFFSVRKDAGFRKFVVHARSLSITVLGTELNVNARSAAAEVSLISGRVRVAVDGDRGESLYLLPGSKVSLDTLHKTLTPSKVNSMLYSAWTDGKWNFRHTSLEEIAGLIEEYYGITVRFQREKSKRLSINAVIAMGSLQKLIPVLEQTVHINMILSDNQLIID